jgi:hypothetical protein
MITAEICASLIVDRVIRAAREYHPSRKLYFPIVYETGMLTSWLQAQNVACLNPYG